MDPPHPYIDLSGVRDKSSSPDDSLYRHDHSHTVAGEHCDSYTQNQQPPPSPPTRRSTTGTPRHSLSNGQQQQQQQPCSDENSPRSSYVAARRASGGYPEAVAVPGGVPVRRRDSIKHPFSLSLSQAIESGAEEESAAAAASTSGNGRRVSVPTADGGVYRATPHGRRHSASVAVLHRDGSDPAAPVNTTVSASLDRPNTAAAPVATTQEDVKRFVHTVMTDHAATLGTWEQRVTVAEVYRDKPLRTGGIPASLRAQDRGFLERVSGSLHAHRQQLDDARSLLLQTRHEVPPTRHGGRGDVNAWDEYCSCYEQTLVDLAAEARQMHQRVEQLLKGEQHDGSRIRRSRASAAPQSDSARASRARSLGSSSMSRRNSPQATPRKPRPTASASARGSEPRDAPTADASPQPAERNPQVPVLGSHAVQRGSYAIRPGHSSDSAARPSPAPESQPSWTRASSLQNPLRNSIGSVHSLTSSRSQRLARALHPDTVVRQDVPTASPNDLQSPYSRLRSPKRAASPLRDPTHAVLVVPAPADVAAAAAEEEEEAAEAPATARSSRASRASRGSRAASSSALRPAAADLPPQLRTYSSPRGSSSRTPPTAAASTTPAVHPLRRRQLLEVIEHLEKHSATLQRGDLHRARECFYELYGEQHGLRQYCLWIDDIALSALRVPQTSA